MKKFFTVFIIITFCLFVSVTTLAHSGGTDANGGHYNHSTGDYHYHHGYPEHYHTDGECPYQKKTEQKENDNLDVILTIAVISLLSFLVILHFITKSKSTEFLLFSLYYILFSPFLIIYYLFSGICFVARHIRWAIPQKFYSLEVLDRYWINPKKADMSFIGASEQYNFYAISWPPERKYKQYILRQEIANKNKLVYFGENKKISIVFKEHLFLSPGLVPVYEKGIIGRNISTGALQYFDWLSKNRIQETTVSSEGIAITYYFQDIITNAYIKDNDTLIFEIKRKKSLENEDKYNIDMQYQLIIKYSDGEYLVERSYLDDKTTK